MPNETIGDQLSYYTQKASDLNRQLGLAALALIWLFKISPTTEQTHSAILSSSFKGPLALIIISLAIDVFQYFLGTLVWAVKWLCAKIDEPAYGKTYSVGCLVTLGLSKLVFMFAAFVWLLFVVLYRISWSATI